MIERSDYTTGERTKVGAYVDEGVYSAFREWVEEQTGKQYGSVGTAIERAMLEYMEDEKLDQKLQETIAQTRKNEALLRQLTEGGEGETREKEKGKTTTQFGDVPTGKNPGDRKQRELHVIAALYQNTSGKVSAEVIEEAIREVAGVQSDKTVKDYLKSITQTQAFVTSQTARTWLLDDEGAKELLSKHGIEIEVEA